MYNLKKSLVVVGLMVVLPFFPTETRADDTSPVPTPAATTPPSVVPEIMNEDITGIVLAMDMSGKRVRIKDENGQIREITVTNLTQFQRNGKNVAFSELTAGDKVTLKTHVGR